MAGTFAARDRLTCHEQLFWNILGLDFEEVSQLS
jgi:hypothetical protein